MEENEVRVRRKRLGLHPVFKRIDSCAAEFRAATACMYSTYEEECEAEATAERKIVVLGGGPNRIGQGIEFDYCCVQAALAMREAGYESIMVNCNPETVSTDYDTSDRLYFEPLTLEDVLEIVRVEQPDGVIVQYGGQTPLLLATGDELPARGTVFVSVRDGDKRDTVGVSRDLQRFGYEIVATRGTARALDRAGVRCRTVNKVLDGRPHVVDMLKNGEIDMIVNTTEGSQAIADSYAIRRTALQYRVPYFTTVAGARALVEAIRAPGAPEVSSMQEIHSEAGS